MSKALNAIVGCPFVAVGCTFNVDNYIADVVVLSQ